MRSGPQVVLALFLGVLWIVALIKSVSEKKNKMNLFLDSVGQVNKYANGAMNRKIHTNQHIINDK